MQKYVRSFDRVTAKFIGSGPKNLYTPSVWLGRLTTPALWASYLLLLQIALISPNSVTVEGIIIVALMPLASLIKLFVRRKRPQTIYTDTMRIKSYSFPSSHAYSAMLSTTYLATLSIPYGLGWAVTLVFFGLLVGVSRVFVGAHYPSDVVGGWWAGALVASVVIARF